MHFNPRSIRAILIFFQFHNAPVITYFTCHTVLVHLIYKLPTTIRDVSWRRRYNKSTQRLSLSVSRFRIGILRFEFTDFNVVKGVSLKRNLGSKCSAWKHHFHRSFWSFPGNLLSCACIEHSNIVCKITFISYLLQLFSSFFGDLWCFRYFCFIACLGSKFLASFVKSSPQNMQYCFLLYRSRYNHRRMWPVFSGGVLQLLLLLLFKLLLVWTLLGISEVRCWILLL